MGLDIFFLRESKLNSKDKENIGYFRKVNFIIRYFNLNDEDNCREIELRKDIFSKFVDDLNCELKNHSLHPEDLPCNKDLLPISVFFGGSIECDQNYWNDVNEVYNWSLDILNNFNWENNYLFLYCWW